MTFVIMRSMILYPEIDPVALAIGPLKIHWYGLMYLLGFAGAWYYGVQRTKRDDLDWSKSQVEDIIFYGAVGVILGGRLGYTLFYNFSGFIDNPISIFYIHRGGMSFHGGFLGVALALFLYGRKHNKGFFEVTDFVVPWVPIGLGTGRIGNFINMELPGRAVDTMVPWAFDYGDKIARHPSSLYQAITEGLVLFFIMYFYSKKPRAVMAISGIFMISYGCLRFTTEFFRTPDAHLGFIAFDWVTMGQLLSMPMVVAGAALYWFSIKRKHLSVSSGE